MITNSDRQHGLEFDCYQEATLVRGARPLKTSIKVPLGENCQ